MATTAILSSLTKVPVSHPNPFTTALRAAKSGTRALSAGMALQVLRLDEMAVELRKARMFAAAADHYIDRRLVSLPLFLSVSVCLYLCHSRSVFLCLSVTLLSISLSPRMLNAAVRGGADDGARRTAPPHCAAQVSNILISYFSGNKAGSDEVLKLVCSILAMEEEQGRAVVHGAGKLRAGGGWGLYSVISAPVSTWETITEAEIGQDWVQFLIEEADKAAAQPSLKG